MVGSNQVRTISGKHISREKWEKVNKVEREQGLRKRIVFEHPMTHCLNLSFHIRSFCVRHAYPVSVTEFFSVPISYCLPHTETSKPKKTSQLNEYNSKRSTDFTILFLDWLEEAERETVP